MSTWPFSDESRIFGWNHPKSVAWIQLVLDSYREWLGQDLIERVGSPEEQARELFYAPFVVVSHGSEPDPVLNYGNQAALHLWEMEWEEFCRTPSRLTTEPVNQPERTQMLEQAARHGYIRNYRGIRHARSGRRFLVEHATVWNVLDQHRCYCGQAATFSSWMFLTA
ncbi:MAG: MEKHLA domain-containing protein [Nitrospirae bacterium]|nr:MAG: MEKHLA domain-containing protein [Nitrospirota bacterium]